MSFYVDNPTWINNIYLLNTTDPVLGGIDGISNRATKELADRTQAIKIALEKQGIYLNDNTKFEGINVIDGVVFDSVVVSGDVVYRNEADTKFYQAIADGTDKENIIGIADVTNSKIITSGLIKTAEVFTQGEKLYLSSTTAGSITNTITSVYIGKYLFDGIILLSGGVNVSNADTLDGLDSTDFVLKAGDIMTGPLTITASDPRIKLNDSDFSADDFWIHANTNQFFVLTDRTHDGTWETPHPLKLDNATSQGYLYGNKIWHNGDTGQSLIQDGYQKLPSGLIIQWGITAATGASQAVTFPITFPNIVFTVIGSKTGTNVIDISVAYTGLTSTGFTFTPFTTDGTIYTDFCNCGWIAIGY